MCQICRDINLNCLHHRTEYYIIFRFVNSEARFLGDLIRQARILANWSHTIGKQTRGSGVGLDDAPNGIMLKAHLGSYPSMFSFKSYHHPYLCQNPLARTWSSSSSSPIHIVLLAGQIKSPKGMPKESTKSSSKGVLQKYAKTRPIWRIQWKMWIVEFNKVFSNCPFMPFSVLDTPIFLTTPITPTF